MVERSVRATSRLPLIVAVVLLILQIFSPSKPIKFLLIVDVGMLGVSYVWAQELAKGVSLQRKRRYGWAQVGDILEERWIMHNDAWVPALWVEIVDHGNLKGYSANRAIGLGAHTSLNWTTRGKCETRGVYSLGPVNIRMGDPFGLFEVHISYPHRDTFVVYPAIADVPRLVEPFGIARGAAHANVRSLDFTTNASSVRQYVPGDALKRIHWKTTARRSIEGQEEFFVKEFDLEPSGDLWLVLDMDASVHAGQGKESTEEYAVTLSASLANQLLRDNHAVGLISYDTEPVVIPPQKGHEQLWEILKALAGIHAIATVSLAELLQLFEPALRGRISVALITPSTDPAWVRGVTDLLRDGVHPTGILLDARTFGGDGNVEAIRGILADLGVVAHVLGKGFELRQIGARRRQEPEYKVLGTGRVVVVSPVEPAEWVPVGIGEEDNQ